MQKFMEIKVDKLIPEGNEVIRRIFLRSVVDGCKQTSVDNKIKHKTITK